MFIPFSRDKGEPVRSPTYLELFRSFGELLIELRGGAFVSLQQPQSHKVFGRDVAGRALDRNPTNTSCRQSHRM